jgi:hypothetical protein
VLCLVLSLGLTEVRGRTQQPVHLALQAELRGALKEAPRSSDSYVVRAGCTAPHKPMVSTTVGGSNLASRVWVRTSLARRPGQFGIQGLQQVGVLHGLSGELLLLPPCWLVLCVWLLRQHVSNRKGKKKKGGRG